MGSFSDFSRQDSDPNTKKQTKALNFGMQMIAIGVLLGALAIATGVAPVSWIKFERKGHDVRARVQSCVFFIVPYHTVWVEAVEKIDTRIKTGSNQRRAGRDIPNKKAEDVGYLMIDGPSSSAEVPIAPSDLTSVKEKSLRFLADKQATELELFVVANWLFSLVFSGLATLFGLIIAGSFVVGLIQLARRKLSINRKAATRR
ncbi:MAG: hypothetical protein JNJ83_03140 [Verrucomicrobiaceae bacterium]|nr:hypothetical protein [Verrucomicrobiaceae bacterium]